MAHLPKLYDNNRHRFAVAIIFAVFVQALAMGISAFATRHIFGLLHAQSVKSLASFQTYLPFLVLGIAALIFAIARVVSTRLSEQLGQNYAIEFRENFYKKLSRLPKKSLSKKRVGALSIRFVGDLGAMRDWVSKGITAIVSSIIIIPAALFVLWNLFPAFFWIGCIGILISAALMILRGRAHNRIQAKIRKERANISIDMMERVSIAPDLRLLGRLRADFKLLKRRGRDLSDAAVERARAVEVLRVIPEVTFSFVAIGLLLITYRFGLEAGSAAAGLAVLSIITIYLRDLGNVWDYWCAWEIARDKSVAIFEMEDIQKPERQSKLPNAPLSLRFENVQMENFEPVSFSLKAGSNTELLGAEKDISSLFDLIAGFEDYNLGAIYIDDEKYEDLSQKIISRRIHLVSEHGPILQGSLRRAATMGCRKRPDDDTILGAIDRFGLTACCERIGGLGGRVDEHGNNLSRLERMKLFILRAYLACPRLLLINVPLASYSSEISDYIIALVGGIETTALIYDATDKVSKIADDKLRIKFIPVDDKIKTKTDKGHRQDQAA